MLQLYVITYQNMHWCGGKLHCTVWATDEDDARDRACYFMDDTQFELFGDHYEEEPEMDDGCYATVDNVELVEESDLKEYIEDPDQASFYPCVNDEDAPKKE